MGLKLHVRGRYAEGLENPSLKELLDYPQPFMISAPKDEGKNNFLSRDILYAQWHPVKESILEGILIKDYEAKKSYFVRRGSNQFEEREGTGGPWHGDKFLIYASGYEFSGELAELVEEFKSLGFVFPS